MSAPLLAELAALFSAEAIEADRDGDAAEAERLWAVACELELRARSREGAL